MSGSVYTCVTDCYDATRQDQVIGLDGKTCVTATLDTNHKYNCVGAGDTTTKVVTSTGEALGTIDGTSSSDEKLEPGAKCVCEDATPLLFGGLACVKAHGTDTTKCTTDGTTVMPNTAANTDAKTCSCAPGFYLFGNRCVDCKYGARSTSGSVCASKSVTLIGMDGRHLAVPAGCQSELGFLSAKCDARSQCGGANYADNYVVVIDSAFSAHCACAVRAIDGTCKAYHEDWTVEQYCGKNALMSETPARVCSCDWGTGAVLSQDGSKCLSAAECMGMADASVDYSLRVCTCGSKPYSNGACVNPRTAGAICPLGYVMQIDGSCVNYGTTCSGGTVKYTAGRGLYWRYACECDAEKLPDPIW